MLMEIGAAARTRSLVRVDGLEYSSRSAFQGDTPRFTPLHHQRLGAYSGGTSSEPSGTNSTPMR